MHQTCLDFFEICRFPEEAVAEVTRAAERLAPVLDIKALQNRFFADDTTVWTELKAAADRCGIHTFTADLVLLVLFVPEAKVRYEAAGISELFWDSMKDIRYKMMETHYIHGIWGVYCGWWLQMLLKQQCICLGRLQFEPVTSHCDCRIGEHILHAGDLILNVHIPSFGKLKYEDVLESYRRAGEFFHDRFSGRPIWVQAETWILYPPVNEMLPEGNLRRWASDYKLVHHCIDPNQDDRYRIFHLPNGTPMEQYPQNNPLQCALKAWLMEGNTMGIGFGYLLLEDGRIVEE